MKRVVGLPGDVVCVSGGGGVLDGEDGGEEGRKEKKGLRYARVPVGHCWLAGDNAAYSLDSRHYGPVPLAMVRGKVLAVGEGVFDWRWIGSEEMESVE